jgi:hypothetical protein
MRLLRPLIIAAVLLPTLSGCFLLPTEAEQPSATETAAAGSLEPAVGDCWEGTYSNYSLWVAWRGDAPVDCSERHHSYTFAMSDAFEDAEGPYVFGGWYLEDSAPIAYESCRDLLADYLGQQLSEWARLEVHYFAPSAQEWRKGARWLRCDLAVVKAGSSLYEPELQRLPDDAAELVADLQDDADRFDFCIDTFDGWFELGPYYSADAYFSDCSGDPMWRLMNVNPAPWEGGDYPGDAAVQQVVADTCFNGAPIVAPFAADYPDEEYWNEGWMSVSCWRYEWEVPETGESPI